MGNAICCGVEDKDVASTPRDLSDINDRPKLFGAVNEPSDSDNEDKSIDGM